jgi:hypothetical protein
MLHGLGDPSDTEAIYIVVGNEIDPICLPSEDKPCLHIDCRKWPI